MPVRDPKEVFLVLLSNVRQGAERGTKIYQEISQLAQDPDIKEALECKGFHLRANRRQARSMLRTSRREAGEKCWTSSRNFY